MKIVLSLLTIISLFTACVDKNGFDNFHFTPEQEQWHNNEISSKIQDQTGFQGAISAVYLNKVMPTLYKGGEYFYVTLYLKDATQKISFTLNDQLSIFKEELPSNNEFKTFTNDANKWTKYYIVGFMEQKGIDTLSLEAKNNGISSSKMIFKKDE